MNIFKSKISETEQSLVNLQEEFDSLNEQFETAKNESVSLSEQLSTITSEFNRVNEENKVLQEQLEQVNAEIVEVVKESADAQELATQKAIDIVASIGVPAVEATEEIDEETNILESLRALKGKELQAFYNDHKKEILASFKS